MKTHCGRAIERVARFVLLAFLLGLATQAFSENGAPYRVGYRVVDLKHPIDGKPLTVALWYPTAAPPSDYRYGGSTLGRVATEAPPLAGGAYPLFVFSHGYGGGGLSAVYLCEALAARGWIVAAPDHHDRNSAVRIRGGQQADFDRRGLLAHAREITASTPADRPRYMYRIEETKTVLDSLPSLPDIGALIDPARIAVGGHSFGGFTALGVAGTLPQRQDPRISALLLLSTGAGAYLYDTEEMSRVRVPVMLFFGEKEERQTRGEATMLALTTKLFDHLSGHPRYLLEVKGANHFSFNNRLSDTLAARLMSGTSEQFAMIDRYAIAFLETQVAGRPQQGTLGEAASDGGITRFRVVREIDQANR